MNDSEPRNPDKETGGEQSQALLVEAYVWAGKLIDTHPDPERPTIGISSFEDPESPISATVVVGDMLDGFKIEYTERNVVDSTRDIVIEYSLDKGNRGKYTLMTTGIHPSVVDSLLAADVSDDEFAKAMQATQQLQEDSERPATSEEVEEFHKILELATFGAEKFDFDEFQWQYDDVILDREDMQRDADHLADNNPDQ